MATRRPFWKWHRWKSLGFCLWPPWTCTWNLKLKFQSKLDLCSGNHVVYRQTDGRTDGQTDGQGESSIPPPPTSLGGGIINERSFSNSHPRTFAASRTKFCEILIKLSKFPVWKMLFKRLFAKCLPFCSGLCLLIVKHIVCFWSCHLFKWM